MKNVLILCLFFVSINSIFAQKGVPANAVATLKQKFPEAQKSKWEKEKNGDFEANFKVNGKSMSATFSPKGEWLETESGIPVSDLPAPVMAAFKKAHGEAKIKAADKIESATAVSYEIEYKSGLVTKEIVYDAQGLLVK
jgi:ribosome-associated toxin RatA of RatAB toxin-antitoxin module